MHRRPTLGIGCLALLALVASTGCKAGAGDSCAKDSDCAQGLACTEANVCESREAAQARRRLAAITKGGKDRARQIAKAAANYFEAPRVGSGGIKAVCGFPTSVTLTPPLKQACSARSSGGHGMFGESTLGDADAWLGQAVRADDEASHFYAYEFTSSGELRDAKFVVKVHMDLDCDGDFVTFEASGKASPESNHAECFVEGSALAVTGSD